MNCQKCGKPVLDETSTFCAYCGQSLTAAPEPSTSTSPSLSNAGMLTLIAATFTLAMAIIGLSTYQTYTTYSLYYGVETPEAIGFLIFSGVGLAAAALGFLASMFSFRGNHYKLALIGSGFMCASAFVTIIVVYIFALGFSDGIISTAIPTVVFALAGLFFISNSKAGFTDYVAPSEYEEDTEDTETEETSEDDKEFDESVIKE